MVKKQKSYKFKTSKKTKNIKSKKIKTPITEVRKAVSSVASKVKSMLKPITEKVEVHVMRKSLGKSPEEYHFVLHDGRKLKSLYDLVDELETMSEDAFKEYVTDFRNDFANWTKDVFNTPDLAEELTHIKNRFETQKAIMKHMLREAKQLVLPTTEHKTHNIHKQECEHKEFGACKDHVHTKSGKCIIK